MTTAREITRVMRQLYPSPVRLSVRADTGPGSAGRFLLRVPRACDSGGMTTRDWPWLADYLARHLGGQVTVSVTRERFIKRRDCGKDVEFAVRIGETS
jgi:hypothetical protein